MDLKIFTDNIDGKALDQIYTLCKHPAFADCKVRIMPDVHAGAGCVIGFTAHLGNKVVPNLVGVDIGCGMLTVCLGKINIDFDHLDAVIRANIPSGRNVHNSPRIILDRGLRCYSALQNKSWLECSIGTLGGGNHFIEIDVDEDGNKYLVIHSGSRNLGKQVCEHYQNLAISNLIGHNKLERAVSDLIAEYKAVGRQSEISSAIEQLKQSQFAEKIPKELCYLEGKDRDDYLHDMEVCQAFAAVNRANIASIIMVLMGWREIDRFETIHNYIDHGSNIVRKGAISAQNGERVLIPMNMRDGCIIGIGKGNEDWNCSAPHGAGRIMSRSQAKNTISLEEFESSMLGIYTTSVGASTIDEAPIVYKPMEEIMRFIEPTVEIERIIKPLYNFKAAE